MSDNEKLIGRLRAVIETATSDSMSVEHDRVITKAEHDSCQAERHEAEAVRDAVIAELEKMRTPTDDEREAMRRIIAQGSYSRHGDDPPYADVADRLATAGFGFRRADKGAEPECEHGSTLSGLCAYARHRGELDDLEPGSSEPQGEPSDAPKVVTLDDVYESTGLKALVAEARSEGDWCCEVGCGNGACETCPCCSAGWCISGVDGVPDDPEDRERWLEVAAEHNPVAAALRAAGGVR